MAQVLSNLSPEVNLFRQRMDHLNRWIRANGFDRETSIELRTYLHATKHVQESRAWEYVARAFLHKCRLRASTPSNPNPTYSHPYPIPLSIFTLLVAQP